MPTWRHLDNDAEYLAALLAKIEEETAELRTAPLAERVEELADLFEVMSSLVGALGLTETDMRNVAAHKRADRGGFAGRIWLEHVVLRG